MRRRGLACLAIRAIVTAGAVLALRWPLPVFWSSVRGEGAVDATISAFLASFALGLCGLPGFLAALWGWQGSSGSAAPRWIRVGLVATLASSLTTAGWIAISVQEIRATLETSEIVAQTLPLAVTAVAAVVLRIHVARVTRH